MFIFSSDFKTLEIKNFSWAPESILGTGMSLLVLMAKSDLHLRGLSWVPSPVTQLFSAIPVNFPLNCHTTKLGDT